MSKKPPEDSVLSVASIQYKEGDLIYKEGDFGLSIYKVIKGNLEVFREFEGVEIPLSIVGPGAVVGEMIFLQKSVVRRQESVRAIDNCLLEIWHPSLLEEEYEQIPPIMKYIADQALNRLVKMNSLVVRFIDQKNKHFESQKIKDSWSQKRRYYRKAVELPFDCRPIRSLNKKNLSGFIKDISLGGAFLEARSITKENKSRLKLGDEFVLNATLPNGKKVNINFKITSQTEGTSRNSLNLGVVFTNMSESSSKNLGFFLMP